MNAALLAEIIARWHARSAFVEFVGARPGEGAVGAFAFGRARGVIEGTCGALGVSVKFITAPSWKRRCRDTAGEGRRERRGPLRGNSPMAGSGAALFARVKDDGRAEAALIAVAGLMREGRL